MGLERQVLLEDELAQQIERHKNARDRIVFTSGVFDLLHRGHILCLNAARALGDVSVVAVNTDESVKRKKGPARPINTAVDRAFALANLRCVDYVTIFDAPDNQPIHLLKLLKPDVFVKSGGEWTYQTLVGKDIVEAYGGKAVIVPNLTGYSTTSIIKKIVAQYP